MEQTLLNSFLETQQCHRLNGSSTKLMTVWYINTCADPGSKSEIRRGMTVTSVEGRVVGRVAAVVVQQDGWQAICLILTRLPEEAGYQSLPVTWVERVEGDEIFLNLHVEDARTLPAWHPD